MSESERMACKSIEEPLCNYLSVFDGTKRDFDDIRPRFDELYDDNLIHLVDGHPIDKRTFARVNERLLEQRVVATLEDIYFTDDNHVEYTVHWKSGCASMVTHVSALVVDGRIVKIEPCAETKGVFAHIFRDCARSVESPLSKVATLLRRTRRTDGVKRVRGWARKSSNI